MARQLLTTSNLHGFNRAFTLPGIIPELSVANYFVDKQNYPAIYSFYDYGNFNTGEPNPTRCILMGSFTNFTAEAGTDKAYANPPTIDLPPSNPPSPRNDENRLYNFALIENTFKSPETLTASLTLIRIPYRTVAPIYGRYERWIASSGESGEDTIYDILDDTFVDVSTAFETMSYRTIHNIRTTEFTSANARYRGYNTGTGTINIPAGSFVSAYSVALGNSVPDWGPLFDNVNAIGKGSDNLDPTKDLRFLDTDYSYSTSLAYMTVLEDATNVVFRPLWSGNPYQITLIRIYS